MLPIHSLKYCCVSLTEFSYMSIVSQPVGEVDSAESSVIGSAVPSPSTVDVTTDEPREEKKLVFKDPAYQVN